MYMYLTDWIHHWCSTCIRDQSPHSSHNPWQRTRSTKGCEVWRDLEMVACTTPPWTWTSEDGFWGTHGI